MNKICLQHDKEKDRYPIIGTCPDMCPEKERLKRTSENDIDEFERTDKQILLVKRYVWDQENCHQLSHELRPEHVLEFTLNYILYHCLVSCQHTENDTFDFLYDRTRSIRQDIELQELCSLDVAELIEKCVRLHIHSIARLIADKATAELNKMNTEYLDDCLQLLFRLYDDLYEKQSIRCLNEAEFRAYQILLNLNDEINLSTVLQMHNNIQASREVQFSLSVHMSLTTTNYQKFFELLSKATYLPACIMLRYLTEIRKKSIELFISQTHIFPSRMKISKLTQMLSFEDFNQCKLFINYFNLRYESDPNGGTVYLNGKDYKIPDTPYTLNARSTVVDNKLQTSVVQTISGMNIFEYPPVNTDTKLQNSFDEEG